MPLAATLAALMTLVLCTSRADAIAQHAELGAIHQRASKLAARPQERPKSDTTSIAAYLHAGYVEARAYLADLPTAQAALAKTVTTTGAECPHLLDDAPSGQGAEAVATETTGLLFVTIEHSLARASLRYAATIAHLRWHSHLLEQLIAAQAVQERSNALTPAPSLCADARAWVNSAFQTVPATTEAFDVRYGSILTGSEIPSRIMKMIDPKETHADRNIVRRTDHIALKYSVILDELSDRAEELDDLLGLKAAS